MKSAEIRKTTKDFWQAAGVFQPSDSYVESRTGYVYNLGGCGLGYYQDDTTTSRSGSGSPPGAVSTKACELLLEVLIPPRGCEAYLSDASIKDGSRRDAVDALFRAPQAAIKKGEETNTAIMCVNPNSLNALNTAMLAGTIPSGVAITAVQEARVADVEISDQEEIWSNNGWNPSIIPCAGRKNKSGGIALMTRKGIHSTRLSSRNTGIRILENHRCGMWAVDGSMKGGYVIAVVYLHDSEGASADNMKILNDVTRALLALGRPYLIMGDWNLEPQELHATNIPDGFGMDPVCCGEPTCYTPLPDGGSCDKQFDYAMASHHWQDKCTAAKINGMVFTPHVVLMVTVPGRIKNEEIEVLKRPKPFPRALPKGPSDRPDPKEMSAWKCHRAGTSVDELGAMFYREAETQLAKAYAISLVDQPKYGGREFLTSPTITRRTALSAKRGSEATPHDAHIARVVASKVSALVRIKKINDPSADQIKERLILQARIPRVKVSLRAVCEEPWIEWSNFIKNGLQNSSGEDLSRMSILLRKLACTIETRAVRRRAKKFDDWARRECRDGTPQVFRWLKDSPPKALIAHNSLGIKGLLENCQKRADPLVSIWTREDEETLNDAKMMDDWLKRPDCNDEAVLQCIPSPEEIRETSNSFPASKAYGSDQLHPRHLLLLDDKLLWFLIDVFLIILKTRGCPMAWRFLLMRLLPKPSGGERSVGLFTAPISVLMRSVRRSMGSI